MDGAADWARESLELHASDEREHLYTWKELERGETHDDLWNAGQLQLVREGGLHGFVSSVLLYLMYTLEAHQTHDSIDLSYAFQR